MKMIEVKRLLKFTPDEAILMLANFDNGTYLRPEIAKLGTPTRLLGRRTSIPIISKDIKPDMIQNPYTGTRILEYNRYDLNEVFGRIYLNIKLPTTVSNVIDEISKNTGIIFTKDDFDNFIITNEELVLEPKPNSKRWIGRLYINFTEPDYSDHISQHLIECYHDGLVRLPKEYIMDTFPIEDLDGLFPGKPFINLCLRALEHEGLIKRHPLDYMVRENLHDGLRKIDPLGFHIDTYNHEGLKVRKDLSLLLDRVEHDGLRKLEILENILEINEHIGLRVRRDLSKLLEEIKHDGLIHRTPLEFSIAITEHLGLRKRKDLGILLEGNFHEGLRNLVEISKRLDKKYHDGLLKKSLMEHAIKQAIHNGLFKR